MQKQVTIFGAEAEVKGRNHSLSDAECAALSELLNRPVFQAGKKGKGTWISSAKSGAWARGTGTKMGLTGGMDAINMGGGFGDHIVKTWMPSVIGTCLMDGRAIEVLPSPPDKVNFRFFGVMGSGNLITIDKQDLK